MPLNPRIPQQCHRSFSTHPHHLRSLVVSIQKKHKNAIPPYPYGANEKYKQANSGLYGGAIIQFGNIVSERNEIKTRRTWHPNIHQKRLWSIALQQFVQVKVQARVLRTIDKVGGLDEYLLGDKPARIKELGVSGWALRWRIMQTKAVKERFGRERRQLGLPTIGMAETEKQERRHAAVLARKKAADYVKIYDNEKISEVEETPPELESETTSENAQDTTLQPTSPRARQRIRQARLRTLKSLSAKAGTSLNTILATARDRRSEQGLTAVRVAPSDTLQPDSTANPPPPHIEIDNAIARGSANTLYLSLLPQQQDERKTRKRAQILDRQRKHNQALTDLRKAKRYMTSAQYQKELARRSKVEGLRNPIRDPPEGYCSPEQWRRLVREAKAERSAVGERRRGIEGEVELARQRGEGISKREGEEPTPARMGIFGRFRRLFRI